MGRRLRAFLRCFVNDERGAIAVIIAVAFIPLMISVGVAIDLSRAYMVKQRLGAALDAAGLAIGSKAASGDENLSDLFNTYFYANYPTSAAGTPKNVIYEATSGQITLSAQADVPMAFLGIIGVSEITVNASAIMEYSTEGLELVMVLDNTGSMSGSKLSSLKIAAEELVEILFDGEENPALVKVGLVPFAGTVNIGSAMTAYTSDPADLYWGSDSWWGCVEARDYPDDVEDTPTAIGGVWTPFNWPDGYYNNWDGWGGWIDTSPPSSRGPNKYCALEVTPLTNAKTTLIDAIDDMWAAGYTHINIGAIWGLRLISADAPFTEGVAYGTEGWNKAIIILTDGNNTASWSQYTAYGYPSEGRMGTTSTWTMAGYMDDRLGEVCTNIKNAGIQLYTITFDVSDSGTQALMENCATDSSKYFDSPSTDDLRSTFRAIGAELKQLRISQ